MDKPTRKYPPVYERIIPFALGALALLVIVLVLVTIFIALGVIPTPA
jgi:uncharacterized membrane protein YccC